MDEERKLVIELQGKLAELDQKVWNYQRDMVAEFRKYAAQLLQDVPKDVSQSVTRVIEGSMKDYRSLYSGTDASESGSTAGTRIIEPEKPDNTPLPQQYSFPAPIAYRRPSQPPNDFEVPRSPHEREKEFQGVFTPSYLPLLGDSRHERRASADLPLSPASQPAVPETSHVDASTDTRSLTSTPDLQKPIPKRRNTDDSFISSGSETTVRRSALRRASTSSMKASPRRVRFEVEGEEVLPTASPLSSSTMLLASAPQLYHSREEEAGSEQVEDVRSLLDDEDDSSPPPKRISSSQALRALSRGPLEDDGTTWTTVAAPSDGSPSVETSEASDESSDLTELGRPHPVDSMEKLTKQASRSTEKVVSNERETQDESLSDDEMLDMPTLRSMKGTKTLPPATILSPANSTSLEISKSPSAPAQKWQGLESVNSDTKQDIGRGLHFEEDDEDELFSFEEKTYRPNPPEDREEDEDSDPSESPTSPTGVSLSQYSRSPARHIMRPTPAQEQQQVGSSGVIGSFKGHPFSMPVVNEDVHAKAVAMGDVHSFVGSVHGRSGFDDGDMASYRASSGRHPQIGSFSERMMLEDLREAEAESERKNGA